jgi:hypothetical protein
VAYARLGRDAAITRYARAADFIADVASTDCKRTRFSLECRPAGRILPRARLDTAPKAIIAGMILSGAKIMTTNQTTPNPVPPTIMDRNSVSSSKMREMLKPGEYRMVESCVVIAIAFLRRHARNASCASFSFAVKS